MRRFRSRAEVVLLGLTCAYGPLVGLAQEQTSFDIGLRGVILLSKGEPANDMMGEGLIGRWAVSEGWHLGLAVDSVTFDYETPEKALGITTAEVVDGTNDMLRTTLVLERRYETGRAWDWFWLVGVGFASIDAPNVSGLTTSGQPYEISTVADDEVHILAGGGLRRRLGDRWTFESTLTFEHHDTHYEIRDLVSGATGTIESHSPYGIALGISYGF